MFLNMFLWYFESKYFELLYDNKYVDKRVSLSRIKDKG